MTEKKEKSKREPTAWNKEVKKYTDKGIKFPEALKKAKESYKK
jgi:hypothetical protein